MKDFSRLSAVEKQVFPGAQVSYPVPPVLDPADEVWLTTRDDLGDWISGLFVQGEPGNPLCVLHFYGRDETLRDCEYLFSGLRALGPSVLMFDYRGYGSSRGRPREESFYRDAEMALDWLRDQHPRLRVVVSGRFFGTAVATHLAQQYPVAGVMLFSPPTSVLEVVRGFFPADDIFIEEALPFRFDNLSRMSRIAAPTLVVYGGQDSLVPVRMVRRLEALVRAPLTRCAIPDADHHDLFTKGGAVLWQQIGEFLGSLTRPKGERKS
jgi:pimeloyl-ACP methyl ester carboxylesterase